MRLRLVCMTFSTTLFTIRLNAAYKSFDDYRLFDEGTYVESLLKATLEGNMHLFVRKVRPAKKDKTDDDKKFYETWFLSFPQPFRVS